MNITLNWPDGREIIYNCWDSDGEHLTVGIINSLVEGSSIYPIKRKSADWEEENEDSSILYFFDILDRERKTGEEMMKEKMLCLLKLEYPRSSIIERIKSL